MNRTSMIYLNYLHNYFIPFVSVVHDVINFKHIFYPNEGETLNNNM